MSWRIVRQALFFLVIFIVGCGKPSQEAETSQSSVSSENILSLQDIKSRGVLRVLSPKWDEYSYLPRQRTPANRYRVMVAEFADQHGLKVEWQYLDRFDQLNDALLRGETDLVVANMTVTDQRKALVDFTVAVDHVKEWLVAQEVQGVNEVHDLSIATIVIPKDSSFKESLVKVAEPGWNIVEKERDASPQSLVEDVLAERFTATVVDSNVGEWLLTGSGLKSLGALGNAKDIAWAVNKSAIGLRDALNQFIHQFQLAEVHDTHTDDWGDIVERRALRMITRNSSDSYFMWRGELMGYEYDLLKKFADDNKLFLDVIVADGQDMIDLLKTGKGDLIASSQSPLESRKARGVNFTQPYNVVDEVLIGRKGLKIASLDDLSGQTVMVEAKSSYLETLTDLVEQGIDLAVITPEQLEINDEADLMQLVAEGVVDFTVADSHLAARELLDQPDLEVYLSVASEIGHGWAVRQGNPKLLAKLNAYITKHYRGLFFNVTWQKYFDTERGRYLGRDPLEMRGQLSPYDSIVVPVAKRRHFDWRMIVSQMYQESRFNPKARSNMGAIGLMQVLPKTARQLGYENLYSPDVNVTVGVEYLDWVRDRFPGRLPPAERVLFALAGYNAGYGHVQDARRLARKQGLNPDQWFGHVEKAMLLLSKRKYYRNARFGYVRGKEPVEYVRQIQRRYQGYQSFVP